MSSSASSPSIIAQLSAVGRSHSLPLEFITSLEYLYCNLQRQACVILLLSLHWVQHLTSCLNQVNEKPCSLTCVSSSRNSSWCWSAARQLSLQWKHQTWARSPGTRMHWLWTAAGALLHDIAVAPATRKWFSETQHRILSSHANYANPGSTSGFWFVFFLLYAIYVHWEKWCIVGRPGCRSNFCKHFTWIPWMHALTISL